VCKFEVSPLQVRRGRTNGGEKTREENRKDVGSWSMAKPLGKEKKTVEPSPRPGPTPGREHHENVKKGEPDRLLPEDRRPEGKKLGLKGHKNQKKGLGAPGKHSKPIRHTARLQAKRTRPGRDQLGTKKGDQTQPK